MPPIAIRISRTRVTIALKDSIYTRPCQMHKVPFNSVHRACPAVEDCTKFPKLSGTPNPDSFSQFQWGGHDKVACSLPWGKGIGKLLAFFFLLLRINQRYVWKGSFCYLVIPAAPLSHPFCIPCNVSLSFTKAGHVFIMKTRDTDLDPDPDPDPDISSQRQQQICSGFAVGLLCIVLEVVKSWTDFEGIEGVLLNLETDPTWF